VPDPLAHNQGDVLRGFDPPAPVFQLLVGVSLPLFLAPGLLTVGRNALTAWVLLHLLVYYPAWLVFPSWERLPLGEGLVAVAAIAAALCAGTAALARRGIRVAL